MTVPGSIASVVLAAGASRRLGAPKQLAELDGEPLVHRTVRRLAASQCSSVAVVVGARAENIAAAVSNLRPIVLVNEAWEEGIASSIRVGTTWASAAGYDAILIAVCDQPLLTTAHVDALIATFRAEGRPIGSAYEDVVGVPAVFDRRDFSRLMALRGDRGAGALLRSGAGSVSWPDGSVDVDTAEDMAALTSGLRP